MCNFCYKVFFFLFKQYLKLNICSKSSKLLIARAYVVSHCGYILSHGWRLIRILKEAKKEKIQNVVAKGFLCLHVLHFLPNWH